MSVKKFKMVGIGVFISICLSCEEILLEKDISTEPVTLFAPIDGSVIKSNQAKFNWSRLEFADSYTLQVAKPNFENASQIIINTTLEENTYEEALSPGEYEWRVQAFNSGYNTLFSSASFSVKEPESFTDYSVQLLTPLDEEIYNNRKVSLTWGKINGAQLYRIELLQDGEIYLQTSTENTQIELDFVSGTTRWKVRAENEGQYTPYSSRVLTIDVSDPNVPELQSPEDNSTLRSTLVDFQWSREPIEGSQEFDSLYIYHDVALKDLAYKERVDDESTQVTLERDSTYYWNMKTFDMAGNSSEVSETFLFSIQ